MERPVIWLRGATWPEAGNATAFGISAAGRQALTKNRNWFGGLVQELFEMKYAGNRYTGFDPGTEENRGSGPCVVRWMNPASVK